jgi:ATP-binding cassette subfamily G (WHITE) protein 2
LFKRRGCAQVGGLLPGGLTVRGISGGEKRRLSIACGCVGAPRIIALDEPTSGLDANAALVVMQCMARLAAQQRIVISSIHQPRASIWDLFTKVQVLSEGRMLYFGPTDQVHLCLSFGPERRDAMQHVGSVDL